MNSLNTNQFILENEDRAHIFYYAVARQSVKPLNKEHIALEGMEDWASWDESKEPILLVPDSMKI
nr:hypothetical protein 5 [bacterium]